MNILLDYAFSVSTITPAGAASVGFLKKVCVVVKPTGEVATGTITACTTNGQIAALTDNVEAQQLLSAGMASVYILPMDDLDLADALEGHESDFFTVLISSDFSDDEINGEGDQAAVAEVKASRKFQDILYTSKSTGVTGNSTTVVYTTGAGAGAAVVSVIGQAITVQIDTGVTTAATIKTAVEAEAPAHALVGLTVDSGDETDPQVAFTVLPLQNGVSAVVGVGALDVGEFTGVVGTYSNDDEVAAEYAAIENRCGFYSTNTNKAKNMFYAFGKMLSNAADWGNQQYITMPLADDVDTLGEAEALFDNKVSFVINDDEFGKRLALFSCGGKAIVAPYIKKNLEINMQSTALSFISGNQPSYDLKNATLLENALKDDIQAFVALGWIESGTVSVSLVEDNFVANSSINISEPKALWRVFAEISQTL